MTGCICAKVLGPWAFLHLLWHERCASERRGARGGGYKSRGTGGLEGAEISGGGGDRVSGGGAEAAIAQLGDRRVSSALFRPVAIQNRTASADHTDRQSVRRAAFRAAGR